MIPTVEQLDKITAASEKQLNKELIKAYSDSLKNVRLILAELYEKYSNDGVLDFSTMQKYNRYAAMEKSIADELTLLYKNASKALTSNLTEMYITNYLYTGYIIEMTAQTKLAFTMLHPDVVKSAIQNPLSGLTLNQRLGKNRDMIITKTREQLTQGLIQGESIQKMGKRIKDIYEGDTGKALRIAQTETNRVRNAGKDKGYDKARQKGVEFRKVWMSTLDGKTRDLHQKLDGKYADKNGYFLVGRFKALHPGGFGVAEMDINCRCTTRAELKGFEPEKRKDNETKKIIDYDTYDNWKKERVS
jgi:SPP1 gp7 family putative phage head morphogenesis protein